MTNTDNYPFIHAEILQHGPDGNGLLGYFDVDMKDFSVRGLNLYVGHYEYSDVECDV